MGKQEKMKLRRKKSNSKQISHMHIDGHRIENLHEKTSKRTCAFQIEATA